jgi:hypothetical protein
MDLRGVLRGYVFLDRISWDNFNEAGDLKAQVEAFKNFTGYYPESVHVDKIYRNRDHRAWCKERGIRISGLPLGRPFLCLFYRRIARTHLDINSSYAQANDRKQKLNFLPGVNRLSSRLGVFPIYSASPILATESQFTWRSPKLPNRKAGIHPTGCNETIRAILLSGSMCDRFLSH